jgi:hypothetical protein
MKNSRVGLFLFVFGSYLSCSDSRFVLKQHNELVDNIFINGQTKYSSNYYIRFKDQESGLIKDSCRQSIKFQRLVSIVPNESYSQPFCEFEVTYNYLVSLQNYVEHNRNRLFRKLTGITEQQFHDTLYYHDSIYIDRLNPS